MPRCGRSAQVGLEEGSEVTVSFGIHGTAGGGWQSAAKDGHEVMKVEDVELIFQLDVVIRRCTRCTRGVPPSPAKSTDQGPSLMMGVEP